MEMIKSMEELRLKWIGHVVDYYNAVYKNATIKYENENFIIEGDEEESQKIKAEIEEVLEFSAKKE